MCAAMHVHVMMCFDVLLCALVGHEEAPEQQVYAVHAAADCAVGSATMHVHVMICFCPFSA